MMGGNMPSDFVSTAPGSLGGPQATNQYKRAVYRHAPKRFTVEILPPQRQGSAHNYGMRICPIIADNASIRTSITTATLTPVATSEYEIWRRWEDCLYLQDTLEAEYNLRAKSKAKDLAAGRGVQKNGVYIRSDAAASFDSLPPGPDPNSILKNVHEYLPALTKKGTLFRASNATVAKRQEEFTALIHAMFAPELPVLLREIRSSRLIRDFFGFWRRDVDLQRKAQRAASSSSRPTSSGGFSSYFSASTASLHSPAWAHYPPTPTLNKQSPETESPSPDSMFRSPSMSQTRSSRRRSSPPPSSEVRQAYEHPPASAPAVPGITFSRSNSSDDSDLVSPASDAGLYSGSYGLRHSKSFDPTHRAFDALRLGVESSSEPVHTDDESHYGTYSTTTATLSPGVGRRLRTNSGAARERRAGLIFETPPISPDRDQGRRIWAELDSEPTVDDDVNGIPGLSSSEDGHGHIADDDEAADTLGSLSRRPSSNSHRRGSAFLWPGDSVSARSSWSTDAFASSAASTADDSSVMSPDGSRPVSIATTISVDIETAFPKPPSLPWGTLPHERQSMPSRASDWSDGGRRTPRPATSPQYTPTHSQRPSFDDNESVVDAYFQSTRAPPSTPAEPATTAVTPRRQRVSVAHPVQGALQFHRPWTAARAREPLMSPIPEPGPTSPGFPSPDPLNSFAPSSPASSTLSNRRVHPSPSMSSISSSIGTRPGSSDGGLVLKVAAEDDIVLVRVPYGASFATARQRIAVKLAEQNVPLRSPTSFALGLVPPPTSPITPSHGGRAGRPRSGSVSSVEASALSPLVDERTWEEAVRGAAGKLTLRVIDVPE